MPVSLKLTWLQGIRLAGGSHRLGFSYPTICREGGKKDNEAAIV